MRRETFVIREDEPAHIKDEAKNDGNYARSTSGEIFDLDIPANNKDDAEYDNDTRSISSNIDDIFDMDTAYNSSSRELGSGKQLYKCEVCESVFKSRSDLVLHIRVKHEGVKYSCNSDVIIMHHISNILRLTNNQNTKTLHIL